MFSVSPASRRAQCRQLPDPVTALPFAPAGVALLSPPGEAPCLAAAPRTLCGPAHLLLIPLPQGPAETIPLDEPAACLAAGAGGRLYVAGVSGRISALDRHARRLAEVLPPGNPAPAVGFAAPDGRVVFGGAPADTLALIAPDGTARRVALPAAGGRVTAFAALADGRLAAFLDGAVAILPPDGGAIALETPPALAGAGAVRLAAPCGDDGLLLAAGRGGPFLCLDGRTLAARPPVPALPGGDEAVVLHALDGGLLAGGRSGMIYRRRGGAWEALGAPMPDDPLYFFLHPDGWLAGVTCHGRLVVSAADQRLYTVSPLPVRARAGLPVSALGLGPDRKLYFALEGNMRVGSWDPDEEEMREPFVAAPWPGTVSAIGVAGERLLFASDDACAVSAYYPDLPYRLHENPRLLDAGGGAPARPLGPLVALGTDLFFAAAGTGAIVRVRPIDSELARFAGVIPGQDLTSLAADRLGGQLVAGGRLPDGADPGPGAALACWSPAREATVRLLAPLPGAARLCVWAAESGRIYVTDGGDRLAVLSPTGALLDAGPFPLGTITSLITTREGRLYGLAGGWLFHLDAEAGTLEPLAEAEGTLLTEVRRGRFAWTCQGRLYTGQLY